MQGLIAGTLAWLGTLLVLLFKVVSLLALLGVLGVLLVVGLLALGLGVPQQDDVRKRN